MHDQFSIDTPENVYLDAQIGGFASRCYAAALDYLLLFLGMFCLYTVFSGAVTRARTDSTLVAVLLLVQVILFTCYHLGFELLWNGQTPGKRAMGLRVVSDSGLPAHASALVVRNLVRLFDFLPFFYGIGLIALFFSKRTQRLGDLAARTVVIREKRAVTLDSVRQDFTVSYYLIGRTDPIPPYIVIEALEERDRGVVVNYLRRRAEMERRAAIAVALAERLREAMEQPPEAVRLSTLIEAERFLEQVARAFEVRENTRRAP
jgi:uncharacterized RDD family membrane protein YckC